MTRSKLPWTPPFLHKHGGLVLSMGQFMQWVGAQVQSTGTVQIWPGTPVAAGAHRRRTKSSASACSTRAWTSKASPADGFMPGMDIHAALTVVGDGPVGPIGQQLDAQFGLPEGHHTRDWAVGMKFVVDLPEDTHARNPAPSCTRSAIPEPEIFGFLYVHPDRVASLGIFVPSWFDSPVRTAYRYLQHWMLHPYLWRYLKGGKLRSWGAKTLGESGRRGEPHLVGRRLRPHRRRLRHHQRAHRLRRGRSLGHRRATRRSRARIAQGQKAVHQGKPRGDLRETPPRKLGGSRKAAWPRNRATVSKRAWCAA